MLGTAVNLSVSLFFLEQHSLINRENFPVLREIPDGASRLRCYSLHSEAESRNIKGFVLMFFRLARARTRAHKRKGPSRPRHAVRSGPAGLCSVSAV
jgi:hypothetical protein